MKFFHSIRNKLMLAFLLVTLIPTLTIGYYSLQATVQTLMDKELNDQKDEIQTIQQGVNSFLSSAKADVLFLSKTPSMLQLLADKNSGEGNKGYNPDLIKALQHEFLEFSRARRIYYQIRFLDVNGQEIVRVDSDGINKKSDQAMSKIIPKGKLQNKKNRYYFEDSVSLMNEEVFVSPLDLNREHGKVEVPHKPVIRYATPLFFPDSNKRAGVILTNIDAKGFLGNLGDLQLLSEDGNYYQHADKSKLWGSKRDLNTGANFNKDKPLVAKSILGKHSGVISSSGENLLTYEKTSDIFSTLGNLDEEVMTFARFDVPGATPPQAWSFVAAKPIGTLLANLFSFVKTFFLILAGVLIFAILLSAIMGSLITKPIRYLTEMAERVSKGDLSSRIVVDDKGEIGHLAHAFERMRISMVKSLERLQKRRAA